MVHLQGPKKNSGITKYTGVFNIYGLVFILQVYNPLKPFFCKSYISILHFLLKL